MPGKGHSPEQVLSSVKSRLPLRVARASVGITSDRRHRPHLLQVAAGVQHDPAS